MSAINENIKRPRAFLISCFGSVWYDKRLKYVGAYLEEKGYRVDYIAGDWDHNKKCRTNEYKNVKHFHYIHVPEYHKNLSLNRILSHEAFTRRVVGIIERRKPDFVWVLIPPNSLAKSIANLKEKVGFKLVFDIIDLWPESFPKVNMNLIPFKMWKDLRNGYLNNADIVVLECSYYKKLISKVVDDNKIHVLRIAQDPIYKKNVKGTKKIIKFDNTSKKRIIRLAYLGSINSLIDIDRIEKVIIQLVKEYEVEVRIIGDGSQKENLIEAIKHAGGKAIFYGPVFDFQEKYEILSSCDYSLNIYKNGPVIGLTLKSIDYFQMGLPLLNTIPGDTWELIEEYHAGINIGGNFDLILFTAFLNDASLRQGSKQIFDKEISSRNINDRLKFLDKVLD